MLNNRTTQQQRSSLAPEHHNMNHPPPWKKTNLYAAQSSWLSDSETQSQNADVNISSLVRRLNHLCDNQKFGECAILISRTNPVLLVSCLGSMPLTGLVEAIPHSLEAIEALYSKTHDCLVEVADFEQLKPCEVIHGIVRWLTSSDEKPAAHKDSCLGPYVPVIKEILKIVGRRLPNLPRKLHRRKREMQLGMDELGSHGLVDSSEFKLVPLHDALWVELKKCLGQLKLAVRKQEEMCSCGKTPSKGSGPQGKAPSDVSHQRLMQVISLNPSSDITYLFNISVFACRSVGKNWS